MGSPFPLQVHTIKDALVVCEAIDVDNLSATALEQAVDHATCAPAEDVGDDTMQVFVAQRATLGLGLCMLREIFSSLSAIDGGFDGCFWLQINFNYLKVTMLLALPQPGAVVTVMLSLGHPIYYLIMQLHHSSKFHPIPPDMSA